MRFSTAPLLGCLVWLAALLGYASPGQAQAPTWDWAHQGQGTGTAWPFDMAVDAAGNTYVVGILYGTMTLDDGTQLASSATNDADGFLVKYTPAGAVAWAHRLGAAPTYDAAYGVALDAAGNAYVAGQFSGQLAVGSFTLSTIAGASGAFLVKYDAQGTAQWARQSTERSIGQSAAGQDVELDAAGNSYISGFITWGGSAFGGVALAPAAGASYAHFLTKYDAAGTVQWARAEGSTLSNSVNFAYVAAAPGGEVYLACSIQQAALIGGQSYPSRGSTDAFVLKYDALGTLQWVQQLGGPGDDDVRRGTVDATGSLYLPLSFSDQAIAVGTTLHAAGSKDLALLKLSGQGGLEWVRTAGGPDYDLAQSAALDPFGNVYLAGLFMGTATAGIGATFTSAGHYDALLLSYTSQGLLRWGTATGGYDPDDFVHIGFDGNGHGRAIGRYSTILPLGNSTLTGPANLTKWFVAQFTDNLPTLATIAAVVPSSGAPGQLVTLGGSGFVNVTEVSFNGTPAASFAVQSASRLTAVVPAGATAGPVRVRTATGTAASAAPFMPLVLAAAGASAATLFTLSPNPASTQVVVAGLPAGSAVELFDGLGRLARRATLSATGAVSVLGLAPGLYVLRATSPAGQWHTARVAVE